MKGLFSLQNDKVQIEEFSYPLDEFHLDEPDFKAPKNGELTYRRGQGSTLIIEGRHSEADKDYPSEHMELYIGRKPMYRSAHKARCGAIKPSKAKQSTQKVSKSTAEKPAASIKEEKPKTTQASKAVTEEKNHADH